MCCSSWMLKTWYCYDYHYFYDLMHFSLLNLPDAKDIVRLCFAFCGYYIEL